MAIGYPEFDCADENFSPSKNLLQRKDANREKPTILNSVLHSNFLRKGQIMFPHYQYVFSRVPKSFICTSAYGILNGRGSGCHLDLGLRFLHQCLGRPCPTKSIGTYVMIRLLTPQALMVFASPDLI
ncbi:phosphatidylinositol N-acetylglucosaminyltransferase subunit GPI1 [Quillaja saponaria]|uniref:Phosphatidylinositol N-acetylglucosaminyltransferase subunit GPI1 n=1 Tax=Quillaja saponaria TaxID=32244 RepID=A0AAD7LFQ2_QUISA|nr:phosphatidylinositol N-acetylglucosaminyltransferase subunit GPI1 [Quillaja saponaria]KAJ7957339.1 phosphatidylinositol N-acetylglucosaminyltransferase subunit GPI1 [Quillaja saponaria]